MVHNLCWLKWLGFVNCIIVYLRFVQARKKVRAWVWSWGFGMFVCLGRLRGKSLITNLCKIWEASKNTQNSSLTSKTSDFFQRFKESVHTEILTWVLSLDELHEVVLIKKCTPFLMKEWLKFTGNVIRKEPNEYTHFIRTSKFRPMLINSLNCSFNCVNIYIFFL